MNSICLFSVLYVSTTVYRDKYLLVFITNRLWKKVSDIILKHSTNQQYRGHLRKRAQKSFFVIKQQKIENTR